MGNEWRTVPLKAICDIYDGPHATPKKTTTGPIFLGISSLQGGRIDLSQSERLSEEDYLRWTRRVEPDENDVVFSYETRLGEVAIIPKGLRACLGRRMGLLRVKREAVDPHFLLYCYQGPEFQETLRQRTIHGSTVDRLPLLEMPDFPISIPELPLQQAIAHILGTLDDKIELLRSMNETLEAMTRALFKSWFIDFDPVRKKAEGQPTGLPPEIDALFPDSFVDSELGEIPRGWEAVPIGSLFGHVIGGDWGKEAPEDGFPTHVKVVRGTDMNKTRFGIPHDLPERFIKKGSIEKRQIKAGDIVLEISGGSPTQPTGRIVYFPKVFIDQYSIPMIPASFCRLVRPTSMTISLYVKEYLGYLYDIGGTWLYQNQSTGISNFQFETFSTKEVVALAPDKVLLRFANLVEGYDSARVANNIEASRLEVMRDSLLPQLISGEIELSDKDISKIMEQTK